jgi:DHA1 family bicyclomycin/chloramphenicol resistance-like MFS transporter
MPAAGRPSVEEAPARASAGFVALIAALMTMTAISIDINLPAIPRTGAALGTSVGTSQLTVTLFFFGFAVGQMLWGPASDRFGRRPTVLVGIVIYLVATLGCTLALTMDQLLAARVVQGFGAGAGSVLGRAVIRDRFQGAQMARVMSMALAAFVTAPIIAPTIGAALLQLGSWRLIFAFLGLYGLVLLLLTALFFEETLSRPNPYALRPSRFIGGYVGLFGDPGSRPWALVVTFMFGALTIYLTNAPAVFMTAYGLDETAFAWLFALIAVFSALGNIANARFVRRLGLTRAIALGLAGAGLASLMTVLADLAGGDSGWLLVPGFALFFFCFGLIVANGTTLALAPHGAIAGAATSALGVAQTFIPAVLASLVAAMMAGRAMPALLGMLFCILASAGFFLTRGRADAR